MEKKLVLLKPFTTLGRTVSSEDIWNTLITGIGNVDTWFTANELCHRIFPQDAEVSLHDRHEAMNRLMQRLRKAGLAEYRKKKWTVNKASWQRLQEICDHEMRIIRGAGK